MLPFASTTFRILCRLRFKVFLAILATSMNHFLLPMRLGCHHLEVPDLIHAFKLLNNHPPTDSCDELFLKALDVVGGVGIVVLFGLLPTLIVLMNRNRSRALRIVCVIGLLGFFQGDSITRNSYSIRAMLRRDVDVAVDWVAQEGWNPGL
jgi:hypothetical protein